MSKEKKLPPGFANVAAETMGLMALSQGIRDAIRRGYALELYLAQPPFPWEAVAREYVTCLRGFTISHPAGEFTPDELLAYLITKHSPPTKPEGTSS